MKKILLTLAIFIPTIGYAQQSVLTDIQTQQTDITNDNDVISEETTDITNRQADIVARQAVIAAETIENAQWQAANSQNAAGVNWDYFASLEPQIPFSTWSKVNNGINWTSIIPTLGINCSEPGNWEANVNWPNWGTCRANGMTPGTSFGGYATGIAAFWCGDGKINGTC